MAVPGVSPAVFVCHWVICPPAGSVYSAGAGPALWAKMPVCMQADAVEPLGWAVLPSANVDAPATPVIIKKTAAAAARQAKARLCIGSFLSGPYLAAPPTARRH
jgi:hypothetical protein